MLLADLREIAAAEMAGARGKSSIEIGAAVKRANAALVAYRAAGGVDAGNVLEALTLEYMTAVRDGR
jgi:hypothetical protein